MDDNLNTKERILVATMALISDVDDPSKITVRQISKQADVAVGAINYHFQTRDNLLNAAVTRLVEQAAASWYEPEKSTEEDPLTRLTQLLKETSSVMARFPKFTEIAIKHEILHGEMVPASLVMPLLREIFGNSKSETQLRLLTLQLIIPLQVVSLRAEMFRRYAGLDLFDDSQRDEAIDIIINNLINDTTRI